MSKEKDTQTCIIVLGMHRSGTSALGGVLHGLGISMGKKLVEAKQHNPKGYFENKKIIDFNDYILLPALEHTWDDLSILPEGWEEDVCIKELYPVAKEIIEADYTDESLFGIKDPRLCILFPFWEKVLLDLDIEIKVILPYRNPMEVYHSLKKRDNFSKEKTLLLWTKHVLLAEYYSRKYTRMAFSFHHLLEKPAETLQLVIDRLSLDSVDSEEKIKKALQFLEKGLKHHDGKMSLDRAVPTFIRESNELYLIFAANNENLDQEFDKVREEYLLNTAYFLHDNDALIEQKLNVYINSRKISRRVYRKIKPFYELLKQKYMER